MFEICDEFLTLHLGLDFSVSLVQRLALLKDLPVEKLKTTWNKLSLNPGAYSLMKSLKQSGYYLLRFWSFLISNLQS